MAGGLRNSFTGEEKAPRFLQRTLQFTHCLASSPIDDKAQLGVRKAGENLKIAGENAVHRIKSLRENSSVVKAAVPQGLLKPHRFQSLAARLKSCPDTGVTFPGSYKARAFKGSVQRETLTSTRAFGSSWSCNFPPMRWLCSGAGRAVSRFSVSTCAGVGSSGWPMAT